MLTIINDIFSQDKCKDIVKYIASNSAAFESGDKTAGWHAKQVKKNEQLAGDVAEALAKEVREALLDNVVFLAAARPKTLVRVLVSRYRPGMEYGLHVDDAMMGGERTDLSFTLFLSPEESYEGGALIIAGNEGDTEIRLPPGSLILYPTTSLHRVAPVTSGERIAIVGWVRSLIRGTDEREILFDLDNAIAFERAANADRAILDRLIKVKMNLTRLWVED